MSEELNDAMRQEREKKRASKPKRSVLIPADLHYELKQAALRHDMFIHEIIRDSLRKWREDRESYL